MNNTASLTATQVIQLFSEWLNNLAKGMSLDRFEQCFGEKSRIYVNKKCRQEIFFTKGNTFTARGRLIVFSWKKEGGGVWKVYLKPEDCFYPHEMPKNS
jgi:hypothetical protein